MFETLIKAATRADNTYRQRQRLAGLSDAMLRDIGMTRSEAAREGRRGAWDAPNHWTLG